MCKLNIGLGNDTFQGLPLVKIADIKVNPLFRRRGIMTRLLNLVSQVANRRNSIVTLKGVSGPDLEDYIGNRPKKFHLVPTPSQRQVSDYIYVPSIQSLYQTDVARRQTTLTNAQRAMINRYIGSRRGKPDFDQHKQKALALAFFRGTGQAQNKKK
jgi:hypothetical protein